jgi:aminoglycoside phosphotransferase (APT) family kinase protein
MIAANAPDPALHARALAYFQGALGPETQLTRLEPLGGGACQEIWRVEVRLSDGAARALVIRGDPAVALPGSLGRREEFAVINAAVAAGAPTPAACWLSEGLLRPGAWAYTMDLWPGVTLGAKVTRDPNLAAAREKAPTQLAEALTAIHTVTPERVTLPLPVPDDPVAASLSALRESMERLPCARPAQAVGLAWLMKHRPPPGGEITLVHGDFRSGNLLFEPEGLRGVLDWEFAHWGSPLEDIGWLCVRDWRFGALDRAVGGLCRRAPFVAAYSARSGRTVSPQELTFWEVYGNLRWAAGAILQGQRVLAGPERDLELLAIPWRAAELEYEALRLIARHAQSPTSAP